MDVDGEVLKVEFYNGNNKLGEDFSVPYSFNWTNVSMSSYTISVKVTDDKGAFTLSAPVIIEVLPNVDYVCSTYDTWLSQSIYNGGDDLKYNNVDKVCLQP